MEERRKESRRLKKGESDVEPDEDAGGGRGGGGPDIDDDSFPTKVAGIFAEVAVYNMLFGGMKVSRGLNGGKGRGL